MGKYFLAVLALLLRGLSGALLVWGVYMVGGLGAACIAGAAICLVAASAVLEVI